MKRIISILNALIRRYAHQLYYTKSVALYKGKMKKLKKQLTLTGQQKKEIVDYYKGLTGRKVSTIYHEYFYSRTGHYSKEYMPIDLYEADIIGRANDISCDRLFSDKNMEEVLLPTIKHPKTIIKNINGYFYHNNLPVTKEEAIALCSNLNDAIIKPSQKKQGEGVQKISVKNNQVSVGGSVPDLFDTYDKNFIIQECVPQHERMSALNPTSINTIRIATFRSGMEVIVLYAVVRIGRKGQVIDNQSKGGISTMINEDGTLCKYAFGSVGDDMLERTDTDIILEGYQIPAFQNVVDAVKRAHYSLPFYDIVGWDVAITPECEPVLIEWNSRPGPSQTACGTGFGNYTERVIREVIGRKNTRKFNI